MKNKAWAKTVLEIYRHLETICGAIDDAVKKTSMSGFGVSGDTRYSADKMIELITKKKKLINLKVLVEKVLVSLNIVDTKILTLFYLDNVKAKDIASMLNMNIRTFFRKKDAGLTRFANSMKLLGYDSEYLYDAYSSEHWIINAYENNEKQMVSNDADDLQYTMILRHAMRELKEFNKQKYSSSY